MSKIIINPNNMEHTNVLSLTQPTNLCAFILKVYCLVYARLALLTTKIIKIIAKCQLGPLVAPHFATIGVVGRIG